MKNSAITVHPEIQDGAPVFSGTRIRIETFFDYMRIGVSMREFLNEFPSITPDQAREVLELSGNQALDPTRSFSGSNEPRQYASNVGRNAMPAPNRGQY